MANVGYQKPRGLDFYDILYERDKYYSPHLEEKEWVKKRYKTIQKSNQEPKIEKN